MRSRVDYLKGVALYTLEALDEAASLGNFHSSIDTFTDATDILRESSSKILELINFKAAGFFLVDEKTSAFELADCRPLDLRSYLKDQVDSMIANGTFAWVLRECKPVIMSISDHQNRLLMHAMVSRCKVLGMFAGLLGKNKPDITPISLSLLSIVLLSTASTLEGYELHRRTKEANAGLESKVRERTRQLADRVKLERLVASLSSSFVQLNGDEIEQGIDQALASIGKHIGATHGFAAFLTPENTFDKKAHEWHEKDSAPKLHEILGHSVKETPWLDSCVKKCKPLSIPSWAQLPPEIKSGNKLLERLGIQSAVIVPMVSDKAVIGILGFYTTKHQESGLQPALPFIKLAGEIFVNALKRRWAEDEKKKIEIALQHRHKMEAIGTLAGGIAHDFNNLLMALQGNISLMLYNLDSDHPDYARLKKVESQIENGANLTRQLLGYARKGNYEIRPIGLNTVVAETAETFGRTRKSIIIRTSLGKDLSNIDADPGQIEQVLLNLFVNAADAMPEGGYLHLKTSMATDQEIESDRYKAKPGRYVLLSVTDTGVGMAKEIQERIFEPFFTTKKIGQGTGLGLASVYGIVKGHEGYIEVDSITGAGTTFRLYFPASRGKTKLRSSSTSRPSNGKGTILFIDDEIRVLDVGIQMLESLKYSIFQAKDGLKGLQTFSENSDRIDLVILDMVLPVLSGGEVYRRMKAIKPDVKVLLTSGYSATGPPREILAQGCCGFIQKPFTLGELSGKIIEILNN